MSRDAPPALPGAAADQEEVAVVGERTFAQRDAECRKRAIDLETETPRKRGRAVGEGERPRTLLVLVCGMLSSRRLQTF